MTEVSRKVAPNDSVFRLLMPSNQTTPPGALLFDVGGQQWRIVDYGATPSPENPPEYVCVSYSWGPGRMPNPFDPKRLMSSRALPVLRTAVATLRPPAIWLDAACMPKQEPARSLCLQSMGAIYAGAREVLAVLSPSASAVLDRLRRKEVLDSEQLQWLETDDWVSRAWTYQEIVNSRMISFAAEGQTEVPFNGNKVLNAVGHAIAEYREVGQFDAYRFRQTHPHLDALETLIEDWFIAENARRSAYRTMSAMVGRTAVFPDDYFYAVVGAITLARPDPSKAEMSAPEYFMQVCEDKGDFSFIYSSAERASDGIGAWRPKPGPLAPIVPWPCDGERQTGELRGASLCLHNMARLAPGPLSETARAFIHDWLKKTVRSPLSREIGDAARETLRRAGFTGCGEYIEIEAGLFFPQNSKGAIQNYTVFTATDIFFNFGAPGLVLEPAESGVAKLRDVGVFVGPIPKTIETVIVL